MARQEKKLPWLRLWVDVLDDEKLALLAFEDRWHYVAILCMKRKGMLDTQDEPALRDRKIGAKLGLGDRDRDEVRRRLAEVQLIDDTWQPIGWDKRQPKSDTDSTASERKRRQRKNRHARGTAKSRSGHGDVTRDTSSGHGSVPDESRRGHPAKNTEYRDNAITCVIGEEAVQGGES